jgi:hypothetical protein
MVGKQLTAYSPKLLLIASVDDYIKALGEKFQGNTVL